MAAYGLITLILLAIAGAILITLRDTDIRGLLGRVTPVAETSPQVTPVVPTPSATSPTPEGRSAATATAAPPSPGPTPFATPTPEPGGRVVSIGQDPGGSGWWSSDGVRGSGADSFLYAGQFDGKTLFSIIRFDLGQIDRGTPLREITLRLTGLRDDHFHPNAGGTWRFDLLTSGIVDEPLLADFPSLFTAPSARTLFVLEATDLAVGRANVITLPADVLPRLAEQLDAGNRRFLLRITATGQTGETLFAWDSGSGASSQGSGPTMVISLGPEPATPVPPVIITPTPMPQNVQTAAAVSLTGTAVAQRDGTATPLPYYYVIATTTPTAYVVTSTPTPENALTAEAIRLDATAIALTTGTFTPTPTNMVTATPTPPATATATPPLVVLLASLTPTPTATATPPPPDTVPAELVGQILFWSDRNGGRELFSYDPATANISLLTRTWPYDLARARESFSPDGRLRVVVKEDSARIPQVQIYDPQYDTYRQLTPFNAWSFDPVWSPRGDRIAFVSQEPGNDEIYVMAPDGGNLQRLTQNGWEWDKFPSWSPDGSQIVFWSNRDVGRNQLWIMQADGSSQRRLIESAGNDWEPVWVK